MNAQIVFGSLFIITIAFLGIGIASRKRGFQSISEFFLASKSVKGYFIISLLVSGSFSLNGMMYQIWLGYKIGIWALVTQVAWMYSFFWLARYVSTVRQSSGLHNYLGKMFSPATRKVAALLSVVGLGLQIGWEYGVAKSAFSALPIIGSFPFSTAFIVFTIFGVTTMYTMMGGMRSNSWSDFLQNIIKLVCFLALGLLVYIATFKIGTPIGIANIVPHPSAAIDELTWAGLISNLLFSVVWQFVDMSTWQTTASGKDNDEGAVKSLKSAGWLVLVAPGVLGTVIGIFLSGHPGLESGGILTALIQVIGGSTWLMVVLLIALALTVMSFVDGMILAVGFTIVTDLLFSKAVDRHNLLQIPDEETAAKPEYQEMTVKIMAWTRVVLIAIVVITTVSLDKLSDMLHVSLFDQVYLVIICQLVLFGPVFAALRGRTPKYKHVAIFAMIIPAIVGFSLAIYGAAAGIPNWTSGGPIVALALSCLIARVGSERATPNPIKAVS